MTIKHIRWVACIGLLAIICLQYVWLVNTYKLTKESIQFRRNIDLILWQVGKLNILNVMKWK